MNDATDDAVTQPSATGPSLPPPPGGAAMPPPPAPATPIPPTPSAASTSAPPASPIAGLPPPDLATRYTPAAQASARDSDPAAATPPPRRRFQGERLQARLLSRTESDEIDQARADRFFRRLLNWSMLLTVYPTAVAIDAVAPGVVNAVATRIGGAITQATERDEQLTAGTLLILAVLGGVGLLGRLIATKARARATSRKIDETHATGVYVSAPGPILAWTVLHRLSVFVPLTVAAALLYASPDVATELGDGGIAERPLLGLLLLPAIAASVAFTTWGHRAQEEWPPLLAAGLIERPRPPIVGATSFSMGMRVFGVNAVVTLLFGIPTTVSWLSDGRPGGVVELLESLTLELLLPGLAAVMLVLLVVCTRFRYLVRATFRHPVTWSAIILVVVGIVGFIIIPEPTTGPGGIPVPVDDWTIFGLSRGQATVVAGAMMYLGFIIASVTGLYLQDTGPQPWLGMLVIGFSFWFQTISFDGDEPTTRLAQGGLLGIAVLVATAAFVLHQLARHWRSWAGTPLAVVAPSAHAGTTDATS